MTRGGKIYIVTKNGTVYVNRQEQNEAEPKTEAKKELKKLEELVEKTKDIIYETSSVFPFRLFPDTVVVDENKVTLTRRDLFFKRTFPIMYEDIITVKVDRGILFAAMEFEIKRLDKKPRPITYLNPKEASTAKKYIMGLVEAKKAGINLSKLDTAQIRQKLEEIGTAQDEAETLF